MLPCSFDVSPSCGCISLFVVSVWRWALVFLGFFSMVWPVFGSWRPMYRVLVVFLPFSILLVLSYTYFLLFLVSMYFLSSSFLTGILPTYYLCG